MTKLKYQFGKKLSITVGVGLPKALVEKIKKIARNEATTLTNVFRGILEVAVKEYWEERKVKKPKGRIQKRSTDGVKRRTRAAGKGILGTGKSYCQYSGCPDKGRSYLKRGMTEVEGFVVCSKNCEKGILDGEEN